MSVETTALLLAWIAIILLALGQAGVMRQLTTIQAGGRVRAQRVGPPIGTEADGLISEIEARGRKTIVFFAEKNCASCNSLLPEFNELADEHRDDAGFVVVFKGESNGFNNHRVTVLANRADAFVQYSIPITPFGVVIGSENTVEVASPLGSTTMLHRFVESAVRGD